jgi:hypothetical protein
METDPMREIRMIRRQISEECGNDPEKVFHYYQVRQEQLKATGRYKFVTKPLATVSAAPATEQRDAAERE